MTNAADRGQRMRALQIVEPGRAEIVEVPLPSPEPSEALVRVEAVTTCPQWDLHIMAGEPMFQGRAIDYPYPAGQPGHEVVGTVVEVGARITALRPGDRVAAWRDPGHDRPGSYAQYVARDEHDLMLVPPELPAAHIAPLELAMCVRVSFESLEQQGAVAGQRIGVSGLGPAGLVAIQMARAGGAREVVGYDLAPQRRRLALDAGADEAHDPRELTAPVDRQSEAALDASIDCAGKGASVQFLMDRTRLAVALFGVLREPVTFGARHWSGLALLGYRPHHRAAAQASLDQVLAGTLDLGMLVSETLPLDQYELGLDRLREQAAVKICFTP